MFQAVKVCRCSSLININPSGLHNMSFTFDILLSLLRTHIHVVIDNQ